MRIAPDSARPALHPHPGAPAPAVRTRALSGIAVRPRRVASTRAVSLKLALVSTRLAARIDRIPVESSPRIEKGVLAGIAVNAALMPIGAAKMRLQAGMSLIHATLYATRRRAVSILQAQP